MRVKNCPKCGETHCRVRYVSSIFRRFGEALEVKCYRCGYTWDEPTDERKQKAMSDERR